MGKYPSIPGPGFCSSLYLGDACETCLVSRLGSVVSDLNPSHISKLFLSVFSLIPYSYPHYQTRVRHRNFSRASVHRQRQCSTVLLSRFHHRIRSLISSQIPNTALFFGNKRVNPSGGASLSAFARLRVRDLPDNF